MRVSVAIERAVGKIINVIIPNLGLDYKIDVIEQDAYIINHLTDTYMIKINEIVDLFKESTERMVEVLFVVNGKPLIKEKYECDPVILLNILDNLPNKVKEVMKGDYNENIKYKESYS